MYSEEDLQSAVTAGAISAEAAEALVYALGVVAN